MCHLTTGPNAIKLTNHRLKSPRQWAKTSLSSFLTQLPRVFCCSNTKLTKTWQSNAHNFNFQNSMLWHMAVPDALPLSETSCPRKEEARRLAWIQKATCGAAFTYKRCLQHPYRYGKLRYKVLPKNGMVRRCHFTRMDNSTEEKAEGKKRLVANNKQCLKNKEWIAFVYEIPLLGISHKKNNHPKINKHSL